MNGVHPQFHRTRSQFRSPSRHSYALDPRPLDAKRRRHLFMVKTVQIQAMPKVTFEVTPELKKLMDDHPEVNWSAVFRQSIERQVQVAQLTRQILAEMNDPRIQDAARFLKKEAAKEFGRGRHARRR